MRGYDFGGYCSCVLLLEYKDSASIVLYCRFLHVTLVGLAGLMKSVSRVLTTLSIFVAYYLNQFACLSGL